MRARLLLGDAESVAVDEVLTVDNLTINLATYQVSLDGEPVDLTLMEYSLLSFLATHPNRAYSREVLLHRVWGFEYCGGTRTVDVHIRRIRSKVGPADRRCTSPPSAARRLPLQGSILRSVCVSSGVP
ncbi:MAG: winged helix-turn-helix domain-containing protein [Collinsella sp.]